MRESNRSGYNPGLDAKAKLAIFSGESRTILGE
jgi:hypothetical protein